MECHKCEHADDIRAGKFRRIPWDKTPCASCELKGANHKGRTFLRYVDEQDTPGLAGSYSRTVDTTTQDHHARGPGSGARARVRHPIGQGSESPDGYFDDAREAPDDISRLADVFRQLLLLPALTREIVLDRLAFPDRPLRIVADRVGLGLSSTHKRLKNAREQWPALAAALPMKSWSWSSKAEKSANTEETRETGQ